MGLELFQPHLPSRIEVYQMAVQIFFEQNHETYTMPEDHELKEGGYYTLARKRIMSGYVLMLEQALRDYREEIRNIKAELSKIETVVQDESEPETE